MLALIFVYSLLISSKAICDFPESIQNNDYYYGSNSSRPIIWKFEKANLILSKTNGYEIVMTCWDKTRDNSKEYILAKYNGSLVCLRIVVKTNSIVFSLIEDISDIDKCKNHKFQTSLNQFLMKKDLYDSPKDTCVFSRADVHGQYLANDEFHCSDDLNSRMSFSMNNININFCNIKERFPLDEIIDGDFSCMGQFSKDDVGEDVMILKSKENDIIYCGFYYIKDAQNMEISFFKGIGANKKIICPNIYDKDDKLIVKLTPKYCEKWCKNSIKCTEKLEGYHCHCKPGYAGNNCNALANEETDPCDSIVCENNSTCSFYQKVTTCDCNSGYYGSTCQYKDLCKNNPCQNGGKCHHIFSDYKCDCLRNFNGTNCENYYKDLYNVEVNETDVVEIVVDCNNCEGDCEKCVEDSDKSNTKSFFARTNLSVMSFSLIIVFVILFIAFLTLGLIYLILKRRNKKNRKNGTTSTDSKETKTLTC
ncbi:hypothetical protein A3Q56_04790 [Intoshia linei]|uniref:EGF-like domain-containing protein n=1 Tax=Intoshia linei TaxID=1819745 RepID=A0A177B151_9BILA|nr:hypothetical protein A3Q56_04790 [Intoshia linei]